MAEKNIVPEIKSMSDFIKQTSDMNDDMVKLIAYTIISIRRDAERIMPEGRDQLVVTDNLSSEAFVAWMIASYVQKRLDGVADKSAKERKQLEQELEAERKYLRVHYVVSRRWQREPMEFEERQIEALKEIEQALS
jgi:hypothetical protein